MRHTNSCYRKYRNTCYPGELPLNKGMPGLSSTVTQNAYNETSKMNAAHLLIVRPREVASKISGCRALWVNLTFYTRDKKIFNVCKGRYTS